MSEPCLCARFMMAINEDTISTSIMSNQLPVALVFKLSHPVHFDHKPAVDPVSKKR